MNAFARRHVLHCLRINIERGKICFFPSIAIFADRPQVLGLITATPISRCFMIHYESNSMFLYRPSAHPALTMSISKNLSSGFQIYRSLVSDGFPFTFVLVQKNDWLFAVD